MKSIRLSFIVHQTVKDFEIEPLLLIPFVENAFKHISHFNDKLNNVNIHMSHENGSLHLFC